MKLKKPSVIIASGVLVFSMLACNLGNGTPSAGTQPGQENPADSAPALSGACANPYSPVVSGATWNYNLSGTFPDTYVHSIVSTEASGFTEQDVFGKGITRQGNWNCDNGNLIALDPASGDSGTVDVKNVSADFHTTSSSGVTMPAGLKAGDTWTQNATIEGTEDLGGSQIPAKNEFSNSCTAISVELVTVPAGTFNAMRVECQTSMKLTITMQDTPFETDLAFNATSWYAENVGLVKTAKTGDNVDMTIELTSYNIP